MRLKLVVNSANPPVGALVVIEIVSSELNSELEVVWSNDFGNNPAKLQFFANDKKVTIETDSDVARYLSRAKNAELYANENPFERTEVDHWLTFAERPFNNFNKVEDVLIYLDRALAPRTWLVAKHLTIADICVFSKLYSDVDVNSFKERYANLYRWYKQMLALPQVQKVLSIVSKNKISKSKAATVKKERKQEGKFIELPGAEMGKVTVRFPPEASGFLHIGHAKAALLNQYYAENFKGQLIMRFDDTNPAKENVEFEKAILEDLEMLQIKPDRFTHSSDYFDLMLQYCEKLLKESKAYVDDTPASQMKDQRDQKLPSSNRDNSVEKNLQLWKEMIEGTSKGQQCCVRAKIDYQSANGCLRDPTIYRCKPEPHPRTGTKYKVYPTYDFACPIVDAVENVTHTLRTTEYHDRDEQFYWFIENLKLNKPYIWEYSRLNMTNTVLSKRKLTWFVDEGIVDGWDDPRFPTVRGILRRGMTVEGLKQFIIAQGSSRSVVFMEWDKIWAFNKKVIDPVAIRYTALTAGDTVPVTVKGATENFLTVANHPKDQSIGTKQVRVGSTILIEEEDAEALKEGQNATFINWGNLMIEKIHREKQKIVGVDASLNLDNKDYKNTLKLTWLAADTSEIKNKSLNLTAIPCFTVYFDHIITKPVLGKDDDFKDYVAKDTRREIEMLGEAELRRVKKGEIIQLQRKGFFRCDVPYAAATTNSFREQPLILFHIPDGHSTITLPGAVDKTTVQEIKEETSIQESAFEINKQIAIQGNKVRDLKSAKANKATIDAEVKTLLALKAKYKAATGKDWKPGATPPATKCAPKTEDDTCTIKLNDAIVAQGNKVRALKESKADKAIIDCEVKDLLSLKTKYKTVTGQDWKPGVAQPAQSAKPATSQIGEASCLLNKEILEVAEKIRGFREAKTGGYILDKEISVFEGLKAYYKTLAGREWEPYLEHPIYPVPTSDPNDLAEEVSNKIIAQGNQVRNLKAAKVDKATINGEVKTLLNLKAEYKSITGKEWQPSSNQKDPMEAKICSLSLSIKRQDEIVKSLQNQKHNTRILCQEVATLIKLKNEYKTLTGRDWTPMSLSDTNPTKTVSNNDIEKQIVEQGNKVRDLKAKKVDKDTIQKEVQVLLSLKAQYKKVYGKDYAPSTSAKAPSDDNKPKDSKQEIDSLVLQIKAQDDVLQKMFTKNTDIKALSEETAKLVVLKNKYEQLTGQEWIPPVAIVENVTEAESSNAQGNNDIEKQIVEQGDKVRDLKAKKADKDAIQKEVQVLLSLKAEYKKVHGKDYVPLTGGKAPRDTKGKTPKQESSKASNKVVKKAETSKESAVKEDSIKTGTRLGLEARKNENLSDWYSQVITKGEMIEYYDVSGCYILRPWSYGIWDIIKDFFDAEIKKLGVRNCYFPIFVSKSALEREKDHIADFAPEVAWVTKSGESDLAEHIAIRPTSETVMYPSYAKWLKSYRDLPLKLNQWNNVVRWEFKHPQPFLRTREFLWQEGHTAFASKAEADEEVLVILDLYAKIYEEYLAIPVVKGRKTEKEKFAGGDYTTTVEAYISASGRAIQGATSHHLGQNFSKMFDIQVESATEGSEKMFVFQNSWGITTRTIGVMIMVHGDDKGLVLPPKVAAVQAVIVPCGITASTTPEQREQIMNECKKLEKELAAGNSIRVEGDYRDNYSPGWKFNHWELKGVPVRIELGPKDLEKNQVTLVRRDTAERITAKRTEANSFILKLLNKIQENLFEKAKSELNQHIKLTHDWNQFCSYLDDKNLNLAPFCGKIECEDKIKADSARDDAAEEGAPSMGAKSLCIPFIQPEECAKINTQKCIHKNCQEKAKFYTLFGRSY